MLHHRTLALVTLLSLAAISMGAPPNRPKLPVTVQAPEVGENEKGLLGRVKKAYRNANQYSATVTFSMNEKQGRWTNIQQAQYMIALDRQAKKLKIDHPFLSLVVDGRKFLLRSEDFPGAHLEVDAPVPLDYQGVMGEVMMGDDQGPPECLLADPPVADLAMLLARDPFSALAGEGAGAKVKEIDGRLEVTDAEGHTWAFHIDPKSNMIVRAVKTFDTGGIGGMSYTYQFRVDPVIAKDAFAFVTVNSKPAKSLEEMVRLAGEAQDGGGPHPLIGQKAPDFAVKLLDGTNYKLSEDKSSVIILDFWATWCPPCVAGLPKLQKLHDKVIKENRSVKIYAVNQQEDKPTVEKFWEKQKLSMRVLLDAKGAAAHAYQVQAIPQTVVIADGKVVDVIIGLVPGMEEKMTKMIDQLAPAPKRNID